MREFEGEYEDIQKARFVGSYEDYLDYKNNYSRKASSQGNGILTQELPTSKLKKLSDSELFERVNFYLSNVTSIRITPNPTTYEEALINVAIPELLIRLLKKGD